MVTNIMIVGVGGQGTLLASKILGAVFLSKGFDVKMSEVHGMAQRGGSVVTYVRYGDAVASPLVDKGEADYILAFEEMEAARWLDHLKKDGTIIINTQQIDPMSVISGDAAYPTSIVEQIKQSGAKVVTVNALEKARSAGNIKTVNVCLLGTLAGLLDIEKQIFIDAIQKVVPAKFLDVNLAAFEKGQGAV